MTEIDEKQARNWGMFCHLAGLICWLGVPFGNIIGPLVIWLLKKDEFAIVEEQGKEALNFQISITLYLIAAAFLAIFLIGIPILIGLAIAQVVLVIIATVKFSNNEPYQYPFTIRFIN